MTSPLQALWEPVEDVNEYGFGANAPVPDDVATNPPHPPTNGFAHPLAAAHAHAQLPSDARIVIPVVVGTRPEAIKLVPVILALRESEYYEPLVVSTGQHAPHGQLHLRPRRHQARRHPVVRGAPRRPQRARGVGDGALRRLLHRALRGGPRRHAQREGHHRRPLPGRGPRARRHQLGDGRGAVGVPPAHPGDARGGRAAHRRQQPLAVPRGAQPRGHHPHRRAALRADVHQPAEPGARERPGRARSSSPATPASTRSGGRPPSTSASPTPSCRRSPRATRASSPSPRTGARTGATGSPASARASRGSPTTSPTSTSCSRCIRTRACARSSATSSAAAPTCCSPNRSATRRSRSCSAARTS